MLAQPNAAYRTRAKLVVAQNGAVGLYARGSHDVVDIPGCRVLAPQVAAAVADIRARAREAAGVLSGIDVREVEHAGDAAVLVTLFGQARHRAQLQALAQQVAALPGVRGVAISAQEPRAPAFLGAAPEHVAGAREAEDTLLLGGAYHLATFGSLVQAHRMQAAAIATRAIDAVRGALGGELRGARVLELYAGAGALGLELARLGAQPFLVERFEPALALAERAAAAQQLTIETRSADAAHAARDLAHSGERSTPRSSTRRAAACLPTYAARSRSWHRARSRTCRAIPTRSPATSITSRISVTPRARSSRTT